MAPWVVPAAIAGAKIGSSLVSGFLQSQHGGQEANKNWKRQKKVLKNQIQWRVKDAKKAGLHPLAAIGASHSVHVPYQSKAPDYGLKDIGQTIDAARQATGRKKSEYELQLEELNLKNARLQNEYLQGQIVRLNENRNNPGDPTATNEQDVFQTLPSQITSESSEHPGRTAGPHRPGTTTYMDDQGYVHRGTDEKLSEAAESVPSTSAALIYVDIKYRATMNHLSRTWRGRNKLREMRDKMKPKKNHHFRWDRMLGAWRQVHNSKGKKLLDVKWNNPYGKEKAPSDDLW